MAGSAAEKVFDALGNPVRRRILRILSAQSQAVGEIAQRLPVSRPAVSKHLRILEKASLVAHDRQGNRNIFRLDDAGVGPAREFLAEFWDGALARFKLAAELRDGISAKETTMSEPVVKNVRVQCPIYDAFHTFTARIDLWWPRAHRRYPDSVMVLEPWTGGGFFEKSQDGQEIRLGEVLAFEPPHSLAYTWFPGAIEKPTLVRVSFVEETESILVTVTHSEGESALGEEWPKRAARFTKSWDDVLPAFTQFLESEEPVSQEEE